MVKKMISTVAGIRAGSNFGINDYSKLGLRTRYTPTAREPVNAKEPTYIIFDGEFEVGVSSSLEELASPSGEFQTTHDFLYNCSNKPIRVTENTAAAISWRRGNPFSEYKQTFAAGPFSYESYEGDEAPNFYTKTLSGAISDSSVYNMSYMSEPSVGVFVNAFYEFILEGTNDCLEVTSDPIISDTPFGRTGNPKIITIKNVSNVAIRSLDVQVSLGKKVQPFFESAELISDVATEKYPHLRHASLLPVFIELSKDGYTWKRVVNKDKQNTEFAYRYKDGNMSIPPFYDESALVTGTIDAVSYAVVDWELNRSIQLPNLEPGESVNFYIRTNIPRGYIDEPSMGLLRMSYRRRDKQGFNVKMHPVFIEGNTQEDTIKIRYDGTKPPETKVTAKYYGLYRNYKSNVEIPFDVEEIDVKLGINKTASTATIKHKRKYEEVRDIDANTLIAVYGNSFNQPVDPVRDIIYVGSVTQIQQSDDDSSVLSVQSIDALHELNTNVVNYVYINRKISDIVRHMMDTFYTGKRVTYTTESIGGILNEDGEYVEDEPVNNTEIDYIVFDDEPIPNALEKLAKQVGANFWIEPVIANDSIQEVLYFRVPNTFVDKVYNRFLDVQNFKKTMNSSKIINQITLNGGEVLERIEGSSSFNDLMLFSADDKEITLDYPIDKIASSGIAEIYALPQGLVDGNGMMYYSTNSGDYFEDTLISGFYSSYFPVSEQFTGSGVYTDWDFVVVKGTNAGLNGKVITSTNKTVDLAYGSMTDSTDLFIGLDFEEPDGWAGFDTAGDDQDQFFIYTNSIEGTKELVSGTYIGNMGYNLYESTEGSIFKNRIIFENGLPNTKYDVNGDPVFDTMPFIVSYKGRWSEERGITLKRKGKLQESVEMYGPREKIIDDSNIVSYPAADLVILAELDKYAFPKKSIEFDLPLGDLLLKRNEMVNVRGFYKDDLKNKSYYNKSIVGIESTRWHKTVHEDSDIRYNAKSISHTFKNGKINTHVNLNTEEPRFDDTLKNLFDRLRNTSSEYNPIKFWNEIGEKIERPKDFNSPSHYDIGLDYGLELEKYEQGDADILKRLDITEYRFLLDEEYVSGMAIDNILKTSGVITNSTNVHGYSSTSLAKNFNEVGYKLEVDQSDWMFESCWTFECMIKIETDATMTGDYFYMAGSTTFNEPVYMLGFAGPSAARFREYHYGDLGATDFDINLNKELNDGQWHYLTYIRNDVSGKVYLDGYLQDEIGIMSKESISGAFSVHPTRIGYLDADGMACTLDNVTAHSGELSSDVINERWFEIVNATKLNKVDKVSI